MKPPSNPKSLATFSHVHALLSASALQTACSLLPLPEFESQSGHVRKFVVSRSLAVVLPRGPVSSNHIPLDSHDFVQQ